ncbi:hypothetical protein FE374_08080 [Georgenia yuyongxinii]|uniref:Integral membrane protein n=1 Tax=Georgenia yuyongxinii TaxID=2589797 RepID=A0A5B8C971_9MICO|nr:hypothetical protein [Georgenia yuyongxinii]QDC24586.1 hypothetical protein FE374_08080 [Georgenia yuyongxinii]
MRRNGWRIGGGAVLVAVGVVWTLQGVGLLGGSVMTGVTLWAVIGPVVAVAGLVLTLLGLRRRAR